MKSFWQLDRKWSEMLEAFAESEGELTDELAEVLAINKSDLDETIEDQMTVVRLLEAENVEFKLDAERIAKRINSNKAMIQRIRDGIKIAVERYGNENKLKSGLYSFSIKKTTALVVTDTRQIPTEYLYYTMKTPISRDTQLQITRLLSRFSLEFDENVKKDELKKAFANGEVINMGFEVKDNTSLVVR